MLCVCYRRSEGDDMMPAARERNRLVSAVLDDVAKTRSPAVRQDLITQFGELDELLLAVHHRWWTTFEAHLDELLEQPPANPAAALAELWHGLGIRLEGARALLDAHADRPSLAAAEQRRRRGTSTALGLPLAALPGARRTAGNHAEHRASGRATSASRVP